MTRGRPSRKVTIRCAGCARTQTLSPGKVEPCDGYCRTWVHGPRQAQAPGDEEIDSVRRAREILVLGQAQLIVDDAAGSVG